MREVVVFINEDEDHEQHISLLQTIADRRHRISPANVDADGRSAEARIGANCRKPIRCRGEQHTRSER